MLTIALFGAGRIGRMHAANIAAHPHARLAYVFDVNTQVAQDVASQYGVTAIETVEQALADDKVQAILIATPTDTHVDLIIRAAKAGKAILCEKPIDLDISKVDRCLDEIKDCDVPIQMGFNRRFDPSHNAVERAVKSGEMGQLESLIITSRDPGLPPAEYLQHSGGLFRDMMIHDFDMARYIMKDTPVSISVMGAVLVDKELSRFGDVDTAMAIIQFASGALCHINCSRRAVYGYDQRIEAFGSAGMILSNNQTPTSVTRHTASATAAREPLQDFFITRYQDSYRLQLDAFIAAVIEGKPVSPSFQDGRLALLMANAAQQSLETGQIVKL
ncbi:inositol 2-dehydrogenase [Marinobacterium rhizophilum]|uniref:Inositol 2-dehydrogenase n=1 Tax=Marinobacterium rhizophilum TaxID=420402 RepID=A0ABY5HFS2_9GAMM|nr:inositol 2-dehydrogenase [Marinobacterium rhizophilum]UTW11202.1 inositol 2-dehydrogenase [Marinobacterium rhizophilum]